MRMRDLAQVIVEAVKVRMPVLVVGKPGIGKSDSVGQVARELGARELESHPAVEDATDSKGLPMPAADGETARWLPYGTLADACKATELTVWRLEDFGQAAPSVQAAYMQLLLARRVGDHVLPEHVTFVLTTNDTTHHAGANAILSTIRDRVLLVKVEPHVDDWCAWAIDAGGIAPERIAFLRLRADLLCAPTVTRDLAAVCTPRGWARLDKVARMPLRGDVRAEAMAGCVGEGPATEYLAFERLYRDMPSLDAILLSPSTADVPQRPDVLYAVSTGLAAKASEARFDAVATYAERMVAQGRGEFAALMLRDAVRRTPAVQQSDAFVRLACGELGSLIAG